MIIGTPTDDGARVLQSAGMTPCNDRGKHALGRRIGAAALTPAGQSARVFSHRTAMMNPDAESSVGAFGRTGLAIRVMATPTDDGARVAQPAGELIAGTHRAERAAERGNPTAAIMAPAGYGARVSQSAGVP